MVFQADKRAIGERYTGRRPAELPRQLSTIPPVPYYPNLKTELCGVTAAILLSYLEIHHPAPQDTIGGISSPPVTIQLGTICEALQVSRRTLVVNLFVLGVWWTSDAQRFAASRAGREFINPDHTQYGRIKPYSYVGQRTGRSVNTLQLRRNLPRLAQLLAQTAAKPQPTPDAQASIPLAPIEAGGLTIPTSSIHIEKSRLADLLLRASVLDGDRRKVRYPRLRAAVDANLADSKVLSAKQPKRSRNVAVDPDLPDGMAERIAKRSR